MRDLEVKPEATIEEKSKTGVIEKLRLHKLKILGGFLGFLFLVSATFGAYQLGRRQSQLVPQPIPSPAVSPIPTSVAGSLTDIIGRILASPQDYLDQEVEIIGYYRGWDLLDEAGTPPPVTWSDWVIKDSSGAIYIEAGVPNPATRGLEPWATEDTSKIVSIRGVVKISSEGIPYIQPLMETCIKTDTGEKMTLSEAWEIVLTSECVEEGALSSEYFCNEDTGTWWIDLLEIDKPGCAPACVVNVSTGEAEINWRCTGLLQP